MFIYPAIAVVALACANQVAVAYNSTKWWTYQIRKIELIDIGSYAFFLSNYWG